MLRVEWTCIRLVYFLRKWNGYRNRVQNQSFKYGQVLRLVNGDQNLSKYMFKWIRVGIRILLKGLDLWVFEVQMEGWGYRKIDGSEIIQQKLGLRSQGVRGLVF